MARMTIYQKPTCSTCRTVIRLVKESGHPFTAVNYYEQPFSHAGLKALLRKGGLRATDVLRATDERYRTLGLARADTSEDELIGLMIRYPDLLQRPLVATDDTVILARPPETVRSILTA